MNNIVVTQESIKLAHGRIYPGSHVKYAINGRILGFAEHFDAGLFKGWCGFRIKYSNRGIPSLKDSYVPRFVNIDDAIKWLNGLESEDVVKHARAE